MSFKRKKFQSSTEISSNKRASLEISIQAIVIVVLAMTLLGLGLGFIKGMFGGITDITKTTFDKISDQLQRDLTNSDQKLIFSQTKISLSRGKSELYGWGIRNDGDSELEYEAEFGAVRCPDISSQSACATASGIPGAFTSVTLTTDIASVINEDWFIFKSGSVSYSVDAGDQAVERVVLSIPKNAPTGLYLMTLAVYERLGDTSGTLELWATTDIFVTVT